MGAHGEVAGPDFSQGIPLNDIPEEGTLAGRVGEEAVLLSRFGGELFAVSGTCTHYGAALAAGLIDGERVRCPLHHACFDLRTGAALRAPALDPLGRWCVEYEGERVFVRERTGPAAGARRRSGPVEKILIIGGGAAGLACANELRRLGYAGQIVMLSADSDPPCDRPNLSKDYLAGTAPEEWLPLRGGDWYEEQRVELRLGCAVERIEPAERRVITAGGEEFGYDRLLIATGSEPNRLPGFDGTNVHVLRSIADAAALAAEAKPGARAAIIGASFIGMEAAAALRQRGVEVTIVAPRAVPFEGVFGAKIGGWFRRLHEKNGVRFELGVGAAGFERDSVILADGRAVPADFVLLGIGVRPRIGLAESGGLATAAGGLRVDRFMETSVPGIFAAGDIAAYPDPLSGELVRIEHWVVAERQGQAAAANMLGEKRPFDSTPFFWTEQFGTALRYVGHAARWDRIEIDGDVDAGDFIARYFERGMHRASAAVGRDLDLLEDEWRLEGMKAEACSGS
jgi:3-phenylpropionate/trans-cinnamate dioxygenase ferredoxin reductase subunit